MKSALKALATVSTLALASAASATTTNTHIFDFAAASIGPRAEITLPIAPNADGITVTATAMSYKGFHCSSSYGGECDSYGNFSSHGQVKTDRGYGLSVLTGGGDHHWIDGRGAANDIVRLSFNKAVEVTGLHLHDFGGADYAALTTGLADPIWTNATLPDLGASTEFYLWAHYNDDVEFKLKSLTVAYTEPTSEVPLPAAGVLLAGALGATAMLRRRKKA